MGTWATCRESGEFGSQGVWEALDHSGLIFEPSQPAEGLETVQNPIFFRLRRGPLAAAQAAGARESRHGSADPLPSLAARHVHVCV